MERMRAAVITGPRRLKIVETAKPEPQAGEVRIKVSGCGVCASNLPLWQGREYFKYPLPAGSPGHEVWGVVDKVGSNVTGFKEGNKVGVVSYNGFADYDMAPAICLARLDGRRNLEAFPAEPLGCAVNIFARSEIKAGDKVAIIGIGFMGALLTALISQNGNEVTAISRRDTCLETAKDCGAVNVIKMDDYRFAVKRADAITCGMGFPVVIEAAGAQMALDIGTELCMVRGRLVVAGYHQDGLRSINMQKWNWKGLDVINAHERDQSIYMRGIRRAVELVEAGSIPLEKLLTNFYTLEELGGAFEDLESKPAGYIKGCMRI